MSKKLNWFDRLMTSVTFAEAGVVDPQTETQLEKQAKRLCKDCDSQTSFNSTREDMLAHS